MRPQILVCALLLTTAPVSAAGQNQGAPPAPPPSLEVVLARAADYVAKYEQDFAGIVAEERYVQSSRQGGRFDQYGSIRNDTEKRRVFRSDLLLVRPEGAETWIQFRDVFEVDGHPVRDRSERLMKLFVEPTLSTASQADQIVSESARYNVGPIVRNFNVPVMILRVLSKGNQFRFLYNHTDTEDASRTDGAWAVDFREVGNPTMIIDKTKGEDQNLPMEGRIWIHPETGQVLGSIMRAQSQIMRGAIEVIYEFEQSLGLLVPRKMHEEYRMYTDGSGVIADATYSNFRRFQVKVDEQMAPTKQPEQP